MRGRVALYLNMITVAFAVAACASRFDAPFTVTVPSLVTVAPSGVTRSIASCPAASSLFGGGYLVVSDEASPALIVRGSFPEEALKVGPVGWIVEVENFDLRQTKSSVLSVAYCYTGAQPNISVVSQTADVALGPELPIPSAAGGTPQNINAACPTDAVITGGGFRIGGALTAADALYNGGLLGSFPTSGGGGAYAWTVHAGQWIANGTRSFTSFGLCAKPGPAHVSAANQAVQLGPAVIGNYLAQSLPCADSSGRQRYAIAGGFDNTQSLAAHQVLESAGGGDSYYWIVNAVNQQSLVAGGATNTLTTVVACADAP